MNHDLRMLCFTGSRKLTELITLQVRDDLIRKDNADPALVSAYRAGYLPEERREIEDRMKRGLLTGYCLDQRPRGRHRCRLPRRCHYDRVSRHYHVHLATGRQGREDHCGFTRYPDRTCRPSRPVFYAPPGSIFPVPPRTCDNRPGQSLHPLRPGTLCSR